MYIVAASALVLEVLFETGLIVLPIRERVRTWSVSTQNPNSLSNNRSSPYSSSPTVGSASVCCVHRVLLVGWDSKCHQESLSMRMRQLTVTISSQQEIRTASNTKRTRSTAASLTADCMYPSPPIPTAISIMTGFSTLTFSPQCTRDRNRLGNGCDPHLRGRA